MIIYKFKDLIDEEKHSHFYQIVLQNTIWCAKPDSLNDESEFKFKLDFNPSENTEGLLTQVVTQHRLTNYSPHRTTNYSPPNLSASSALRHNRLEKIAAPIIDEMINNCRNTIGVVSFSIMKTDNHLWAEYGGKGNGVCIEINIPDELVGKSYHWVRYVPEKIFHVDSFLESALSPDPDRVFETFRNVLLTKTKRWSLEEEVRFIGKHQEINVPIDGYISEITFGAHVPAHTLKQAEAKITQHCNAKGIKITKL